MQVTLAFILIALYAATLGKVIMGSKFTFVIKLLVMMIVSNFAVIMVIAADQHLFRSSSDTSINYNFWACVQSIFVILRDVTFNVSHWMFSFEYFSIARFMPYAIRD